MVRGVAQPSCRSDARLPAVINDLRSLDCVRARCGKIFELALRGKTPHFSVDLGRMPAAVEYVINVTRRNYPTLDVPYHSRWRHFVEADVKTMVSKWPVDAK